MKRGAEEYITKEHGTTRNNETAEDKPKMSTAAQMARRKIATPKSRTGRSTTPTGTSSLGQSQSSTFQFGAGLNATQSFPPPAQQQSFNFSIPSGSSSFTFGQQNAPPQAVSNPFAGMNGTGDNARGTGFHQDNSMMDDSAPTQQQQAGNLFNFSSGQPASAPTTNGFNFTPSTQQPQPSGGFGAPLFGQKPQEQSSSTSLFGSTPQTNGFTPNFGSNAQTSAPSTPPTFGQSSNSAWGSSASNAFGNNSTTVTESAPTPAAKFDFGKTNVVEDKSTTPQPEESTTPKAKPLFSFGQTTTFGSSNPDAAPATEPRKSSFSGFGQPANASAESQPASTPSKPAFAFGQPTGQPVQTEPASAPPKSLFNFGQPAADSAKSSPANLFGAPSKTAETSSTSKSLFGQQSSTNDSSKQTSDGGNIEERKEDEELQPRNPFSSLFAPKQNEDASSSSKTVKAPFVFSPSTLSTPTKPTETSSVASDLSSTKSFDSTASSQRPDRPFSAFQFPTSNAANSNLFSPKPAAAPTPSNDLFNLNKPTPSVEPTESATSSTPVFGAKSSNFNANAGSTPFKMLGQANQSSESHTSTAEDAPPSKKRLFSSPTAHESMTQAALGANQPSSSAPKEPVQPRFTQPQKPHPVQETVTRAVSTEGPPQIPRYLSADKYKSYDENWRLKALNRRFHEVVAGVNPDTHDFISVVQNYLDHREAIGEGLSQYIRKQAAGTKRKVLDVDDMQDDDMQSKRTKPTDAVATPPTANAGFQPKPAVTPSNLFGSVPSPKPAAAFSQAPKPTDSATSNMVRNMIPGATSSSPFKFGAAPAKSTTPPSSPPKPAAPQLPKFEVPKFGGGAVDFASAFAKNAASSAKKFEKEAMEKRKAEEFDSDEDDEEAWQRKYEEEQKAKKAKLEAVAKAGFVPSASSSRSASPFVFAPAAQPAPTSASNAFLSVPSNSKDVALSIESDGEGYSRNMSNESGNSNTDSGNSGDDEDEPAEDDLPEDQVEDEEEEEQEEEAEPIPDLPPGESLFSRIGNPKPQPKQNDEPILQSARKEGYKPGLMFHDIGKGSPDQPQHSPFTPASTSKSEFVPATTFNFTSKTAPTFNASSVFGGGQLKEGPIPGEGLFGSRPSTPQPGSTDKSTSVFGSAKFGAASDNTWKTGSPIKFGSSTSADHTAPAVEVTAPTPPPKQSTPSSGFFGAATSNGGSVGFSFGNPTSSSSNPSQTAPGYLAAAPHLSSGISSRGSSPGLLSEAESVATDTSAQEDNELANQPQLSLTSQNVGEENEDVVYEAKAVISRLYREGEVPAKSKITAGWNKMGAGNTKVLKDKESGKCRIVFRTEPGANVLLNTRLISGAKYAASASGKNGVVTFPVAVEGGMQMWMIRVKSKEAADEMAKVMEANKGN